MERSEIYTNLSFETKKTPYNYQCFIDNKKTTASLFYIVIHYLKKVYVPCVLVHSTHVLV